MLASIKGPSIRRVLSGDVPDSFGKWATAKLFSYSSRLSHGHLARVLLAGEQLFRPQKLWVPPLFTMAMGRPVANLTEHKVDLIQEQLNLASLGGSLCSGYGEPLMGILICIIGLSFSDALLSIETSKVVNCQIVNQPGKGGPQSTICYSQLEALNSLIVGIG